MYKCHWCKWNSLDDETGYSECTKTDDFTDKEFTEFEDTGALCDCPYFEECFSI